MQVFNEQIKKIIAEGGLLQPTLAEEDFTKEMRVIIDDCEN
jgi:hypothetical protein